MSLKNKIFVLLSVTAFVHCYEYIFISDRSEMTYTNSSIFTNPEYTFKKFNRSHSGLNASFTIAQDISDRKLLGTTKLLKFYHNEYRSTGIEGTMNLCTLQKKNPWNIIDTLAKYGLKMDLCDLKTGRYRITNFVLESSQLPKNLIHGKLCLDFLVHHESGAKMFSIKWYFEGKYVN